MNECLCNDSLLFVVPVPVLFYLLLLVVVVVVVVVVLLLFLLILFFPKEGVLKNFNV